MGNFGRVFIAVILIISLFTVSVFATPTGTYDLYGTNGRNIYGYTGSGNDYITNFSSHLAHLQVYLDQILSYNANISSTIDYYLPNILTRIVNAFSPAAGDTRSMWQLSSAMVSGITAIQSAALGIAQDVYNISTYVDGVEGSLTSIGSRLDNVNVNLNSLNNINWINDPNVIFKVSEDNINYYNSTESLMAKTLYVKLSGIYVDNAAYYFTLPIAPYDSFNQYNDISLKVYYGDLDHEISSKYYFYNNFAVNTVLYISPFTLSAYENLPIIIKFDSSYRLRTRPNQEFAKYVTNNSKNFYIVDQFIQSHQNNDSSNLEDIKNILIDIDNNSDFIQNNNDLQINVDINASDGQGITAIILKLQDLFDFGVGLQEFLVTLNEFDNLHWFTRVKTYEQVNYDPRDNVGYQNLYD